MPDRTKPDLVFDEKAVEHAIEADLIEPVGSWSEHPRATEDFDESAATTEYTHAAGEAQLLHSGVAAAVRVMHQSRHDAASEVNYDEIAAELLNPLDAGVPGGEPPAMRTRRRISALVDAAVAASAAGDRSRAIIATELAFHEAPGNPDADRALADSADRLEIVFARFLGDMTAVPKLAIPGDELALHELDPRVAFLLSRIDGTISFEEIVDVSGMSRVETLRRLCWMVHERIVIGRV